MRPLAPVRPRGEATWWRMAVLVPVIVVALVVGLHARARLGVLGERLADHGGAPARCVGGRVIGAISLSPSRPEDMLCLELAFTATSAKAVFAGWKIPGSVSGGLDAKLEIARASIDADWWLIASYSVGLSAVGLLLMWLLRFDRRTFAPVLFCCPLIAGLLDVAENASLLQMLARPDDPSPVVVLLGGAAALLKWVLLLVVVPIAIVWAIVKLPGRSRAAEQRIEGFQDVVATERVYLAERRRLADPNRDLRAAEQSRPIGLALSGGGIRSATFNLGVLQALSGLGILRSVDYLSTISGGGYIGSCLSSLLSHREGPLLGDDSYRFAAGTRAHFTTEPTGFPFNPDAAQPDLPDLDGRDQLRHLRTHGDFLIARRTILSRDMLRAVGYTVGSTLYHVLVALLFMVGIAGLYLAIVEAMVGDVVARVAPLHAPGLYARALFDADAFGYRPFVEAVLVGCVASAVGLLLGALTYHLPARWLNSDGQSVEESRGYLALWTIFWVTMVSASAISWSWIHGHEPRLAFLSIPMGVYVGGQAVSLVLHPLVVIPNDVGRDARSRFASAHGLYIYLNLISLVVLVFPYAIVTLHEYNPGPKLTATWLLSIVAARFFASGSKPPSPSQATGIIARLRKLGASTRNALLNVIVVALVLGGLILLCVDILKLQPVDPDHLVKFPLVIGLFGLALFVLAGVALDFNKLSLHYFYRDRLAETYLQTFAPATIGTHVEVIRRDDAEMPLTSLHGEHVAGDGRRDDRCVTTAPYHLTTAALNLTASRDMTRRDRKSDYFLFSRFYCGSDTTGYMRTEQYRSGETKLARAMTISGAAVSSAIGAQTFLAQSFALTLLGVRLGQWMENPRYRGGRRANRNEGGVFWPFYLLREMIGSTDASRRLVNLSDGGHTGDNVGLCPLLKRRCALIVACDAEADMLFAFGSLTEALRQAYIDDDIRVELDLDQIRVDPATNRSRRHWAVGKIHYPEIRGVGGVIVPAETGYLIVLKASFVGGADDSEPVKNYRQEHPEFPHQSTVDQFFDDDQFESYRELGMHIARDTLATLPAVAWRPEAGPDWARVWDQRIGAD